MKFTVGTKEEMTQVFGEDVVFPVTVIQTGPMTVTGVKSVDSDGYQAIQVGFGEQSEKRIAKPQRTEKPFRFIKEFRVEDTGEVKVGDIFSLDLLEEGSTVTVSAISKGKGFQGVVKRHNFAGGRRSHGQKHSEREAGSIGATGPQRVFKGKKMPGRMGGDRVTVKNLSLVKVDAENGKLYIKGAVPGRRGTLVEVKVEEK
jgi:large subunit ribosomal protein L3